MAQRKKDVHVVLANSGKWHVVREGNTRPSQTCNTQRDALVVAREYAVRDQTTLFIHNLAGDVRRQHSYLPRTSTR
jgi:hypothetical protein